MNVDRRRARQIALQALFEVDQAEHDPGDSLGYLFQTEEPVEQQSVAFAERLVQGVIEHKGAIDAFIAQAAPAWPIGQVAVTDRVALEIGIYESLFDTEVPVEIAINEAVQLAKVFGGEHSAGFVNGVLRTINESVQAVPTTIE